MGTQSSGLWVKCQGTNEKRVHTGNHCPVQCPSTRSRPCLYSGTVTVPEFWPGYLKKGVFSLVPIKNRSRGPCSGTKCERSLSVLEMSSSHANVTEGYRPPCTSLEGRGRPSFEIPKEFPSELLFWLFCKEVSRSATWRSVSRK